MPSFIRTFIASAGAVALVAGLAAQAKPNFSGEWHMVPAKSNFGQMAAPSKLVRTIVHVEPTLKLTTVQTTDAGDTTTQTTFTTDGKPASNTVQGSPMTTVGKWEGATLVLTGTLQQQGADIGIVDRYTLSDAGKTLTLIRKLSTPNGEATATIVWAKK